jgi:hypothetical protein
VLARRNFGAFHKRTIYWFDRQMEYRVLRSASWGEANRDNSYPGEGPL